MSLHDVSVETTVHEHTAFEVHLVADLQPPQITPVEGLLYGGHRVGIAIDAYHGQAHTVMCHALVYFQLLGKTARQSQVQVSLFATQCNHRGSLFYYS